MHYSASKICILGMERHILSCGIWVSFWAILIGRWTSSWLDLIGRFVIQIWQPLQEYCGISILWLGHRDKTRHYYEKQRTILLLSDTQDSF